MYHDEPNSCEKKNLENCGPDSERIRQRGQEKLSKHLVDTNRRLFYDVNASTLTHTNGAHTNDVHSNVTLSQWRISIDPC